MFNISCREWLVKSLSNRAGNFHSFVFSLHPSAAFYKPGGANTNFQWCGINFSQLPNGIGFGGQASYFGLYVDGTLDEGMSRASATYSRSVTERSQKKHTGPVTRNGVTVSILSCIYSADNSIKTFPILTADCMFCILQPQSLVRACI